MTPLPPPATSERDRALLTISFRELLEELRGLPVAILGHIRPDGDCIGSQVALCRVMRALGWDAVAVNGHAVPRVLTPFVEGTPFHEANGFSVDGRRALAVDCSDAERLGVDLRGLFPNVDGQIDHHLSNTRFARRNLVRPEASAVAEILARLFLDLRLPIDPVTAQALYMGIATDTGQFRFPAVSAEVFSICGRLVELGARPAVAANFLYERESRAKALLLGRFLASLQFYCAGRVCVGILNRHVWAETGALREDTEGLVDYTRLIDGVEIGVLLEEREEVTKGSFRSKDPSHRVDLLANQFNGGGHACAAGFNPRLTLEEFWPRLLSALENHFAQRPAPPPPATSNS